MLKIKDNVDLKELEKYHFRKDILSDLEEDIYLFGKNVCSDFIVIDMKGILYLDYCDNDKIFEKLFDLIQAGLIEKYND